MVELVFVIVILGILASIAVPKLAASRDDAQIAKGKSDIAAIRSSISLKRSQTLLAGNPQFPDLNGTGHPSRLFVNVLDYPVESGASGWSGTSDNARRYTFRVANTDVVFDYNQTSGVFTCVDVDENTGEAKSLCATLTQ
jgi:general secretion pathway protein G